MNKKLSLQSWLDYLRWIAPITGVVHVGAGTGAVATRYAEWEVASVVLVEADEGLHDKLKAAVQGRPGWSAIAALVSDTGGSKDFYVATNSNESGVLSPERLASIWRNLKTKEKCSVQATTLASLLYDASRPADTINWAIIDCIPALPIVKGSGRLLDECDVLVARVVLDESYLAGEGARKVELDAFLSTRGFRCLAWEEDLQPAVGMALYVRDWKASLRSCMAALQAHGSEHTELTRGWQERLEHVNKAHNEQVQLMAHGQQEVEQLTQARDEQAKLAAERQAQLEQFKKTVDEQTRMAAERLQHVEQITKTQAALDQQVAQLKEQLEKQANNEASLKHELVDARQTATLSVKLQALREADLKDLQSRYQASLSTQENQHQLLVKLSERLSLASSYFHQLANTEITSQPDQQKKVKPRRTPATKSVGKLRLKNG
jgi:hypothetical protein